MTVRAVGLGVRCCENLLRFNLDAGAVGGRPVDLINRSEDTTAETAPQDPECQPHEPAENRRHNQDCGRDRCEDLHTMTLSRQSATQMHADQFARVGLYARAAPDRGYRKPSAPACACHPL